MYLVPYALSEETIQPSEFIIDKSKKNVVIAHTDLAGLRYGRFLATSGMDVQNIKDNCTLFLDGHLHNNQVIDKKIVLIGNLTGQNFNENAYEYDHLVYLLTITDSGSIILDPYENPYAMNFYKLQIDSKNDYYKFNDLKQNSVLSIVCDSSLMDEVTNIVKNDPRILDYRLTLSYALTTETTDNLVSTLKAENQLAHFSIKVKEANGKETELVPIYDGLYTREMQNLTYCYYQYINSNSIRIRFDPAKYQPSTNADVIINVWTTQGYSGNFEYYEDLTVRLTSDEYTNLYMIVKQRSTDGSIDGLDRKSVEELQQIIPKEALSRGSITTLSDLRNYFNSINNETSVLHVFRKEDNPLTRVYYTYCLMKDSNYNIVPTNTIPVYVDSDLKDENDNKYYIESGTPLYYYKYGTGANLNLLRNNYIGYTEENSEFGKTLYAYDEDVNNFYQDGNENPHSYKFKKGNVIWFNGDENDNWISGEIFNTKTMELSSYDDNSNSYTGDKIKTLVITVLLNEQFITNPKYDKVDLIVPRSYDLNQRLKDIPPLGTSYTILTNLYSVQEYTYDSSNPSFLLSTVNLALGDHIKFRLYNNEAAEYHLAEVLEINRTSTGAIASLNLLVLNKESGQFEYGEYPLMTSTSVSTGAIYPNSIKSLYKITKFLYTSPLSIVLTDNNEIDSHRVEASYYLDIINEERMLKFTHINSNSPIQYIASNVQVNRPSYLSENRYEYTITAEIVPNIGSITPIMINRTRVIGVYYKDGNPIAYSFGEYMGNDDSSLIYQFKLYTKAMGDSVVDNNHCLYIGDALVPELSDVEYNLYEVSSIRTQKLDMLYLPMNTNFRIYILYKYEDGTDLSEMFDSKASQYMNSNSTNAHENITPLTSIVPPSTSFDTEVVDQGIEEEDKYKPYLLSDMVLTNVYDVSDGINLIYDYTNIMNSYVTMIQSNDIFNPLNNTDNEIAYIVNRVPCIRYFYLNTEDKINTFLKEMNRKILYVLDAIDPLECTFGLDFKFFNTYGPSNMYHITNNNGEVDELIDNVALTVSFRAKLYNEDTDQESIIPLIKDNIKTYLEDIENLDDIHFPNITTQIETDYSEHLIYFEFLRFNSYTAGDQHIITDENMEMLTVVPEFLCVDTNDYTGLPSIDIQVVK